MGPRLCCGGGAGVHGDGREPSPPAAMHTQDTQLTWKPCFHGRVPMACSRDWAWPHDCEGLARSRAPRGSPAGERSSTLRRTGEGSCKHKEVSCLAWTPPTLRLGLLGVRGGGQAASRPPEGPRRHTRVFATEDYVAKNETSFPSVFM